MRRGISLLEVLISTFVLSVGLLGLLSLVPVGGYRVGQVNQFDRSSATGRKAFREFKTRGMLEPNRWMAWDWTDPAQDDYLRTWQVPDVSGVAVGNVSKRNVDDWAETFCIDPLLVARGIDAGVTDDDWPGRTFPYDLAITTNPYPLGFGNYQDAPRMPRVTLSMLEDSSKADLVVAALPLPIATVTSVAERIFMSQNEGIYTLPNDDADPPIRLYSGPAGGNAIAEQFEGEYSWMAMVSRSPHEVLAAYDSTVPDWYDTEPATRNEYKVSIIVFYKRDFDVAAQSGTSLPAEALSSERICGIEFLNGLGLGGGDVRITAGDAANMTSAEARDYMKVSPNQWIMVCSWVSRPSPLIPAVPPPPPIPYSPVFLQNRDARPIYRWYRVVATDNAPETENNNGTGLWQRYLTLDGPDWDPGELNATGTGLSGTYAVLVDGVVAVFERTMRRKE